MKSLAVYGTRPEAIKMAPVLAALARRPERFAVRVCTTGQHREMLDQVQDLLGLRPDLDLRLMRPDQTLNGLTAAALAAVDGVLAAEAPDWLLVQGDTTTAMAAALAAFHRRVRVGHVEAGLRTGDLRAPSPRRRTGASSTCSPTLLFAPTARAARHAARRGVRPRARPRGGEHGDRRPGDDRGASSPSRSRLRGGPRCWSPSTAARASARRWSRSSRRCGAWPSFPDVDWIYPVHRNPNVQGPAREILGGLPNLHLHEPFDYRELVRRLMRCRFVAHRQRRHPGGGADASASRCWCCARPPSGRRGSRPGWRGWWGPTARRIFAEASRLLTSETAYLAMARAGNPYGDGHAGERIAAILAGEPWTPFAPAP